MLSSKYPSTGSFIPDYDEPSPLENIIPIQEFPSPTQSVELPTEEQLLRPSSIKPQSPTNQSEVEPNNQSPETDINIPSPAPSNHEQEDPPFKTSSPVKNEHRQPSSSSRHSPLLSYPARLEDLMRPTPSPFHSTYGDEPQENKEQEPNHNDQLLPVSPPINEIEIHNRHHLLHQHIPPTVEHNHDLHLPPSSPHRSISSNTHHTSIGGDDIDRQQLDSPPLSPQEERIVSPDHDLQIEHKDVTNHINDTNTQHHRHHHHHHHHIPKHTLLPPVEPTFITEHQQRISSEKSSSPMPSDHGPETDMNLYRNDLPLTSATVRLSKHYFSPPPIEPDFDEKELPTMTASQQHSKLSLRVKDQRKKSINNERLPPPGLLSPLPQTDVGMQIIIYRIDYSNLI
jgi:hypothetical protein